LLTEVAQRTGGRYFRARDAEALDRITAEIDRLERTPVRTKIYTRYTELYRWPLIIALLALVLELGLAAWKGPVP
jgi:Ca-activated chloride channel family protein